jgi:1-hydroxycarotenoid 3,4-desaturase
MRDRVIIVGAGVGGLCAALALAARGVDVTVLERAPRPGGKMREVMVGGKPIDAGPTVFTMRWVFEELMAEAGVAGRA